MSPAPVSTKERKQLAVSVAILEVIEKDGLSGITHSKVSRKSGVSRAWIYEYVGKEKSKLVEFGAEVLAGHFARVDLTELPKTKAELQEQLADGIDFLFDSVQSNPVIIKLYFRFRGTENAIGAVISKYEKKWLDGAAKTLTVVLSMPKEQAILVAELNMTLRLGFAHRFATSSKPAGTRERGEQIFSLIHAFVSA